MSLTLRLQARDIALQVPASIPSASYALQNSGKIAPELLRLIAAQLDYLRVIERKVPTWFKNGKTLAHSGINLEQSSSEATARYKASKVSGTKGVDLTGGIGVDSYFLAQKFDHFTYNEPTATLVEVVQHNFKALGLENVTFSTDHAEHFAWPDTPYDWAYLDPSRRSEGQQRYFMPEDCEPNVPALIDRLLHHCNAVMVKYSPMLDLRLALKRFPSVEEVYILAEKNEVKELLLLLGREPKPSPTITCVNLGTSHPEFIFSIEEENAAFSNYSPPLNYLYEPNNAVMKAGAFNAVAQRYGLFKLSPNSHLYTSTSPVNEFPGRVLEIVAVTSFDKKRLNFTVPSKKANIICRNFPLRPEEAKKRLGWKDGGETYLYLTEDSDKRKIAIVAQPIASSQAQLV